MPRLVRPCRQCGTPCGTRRTYCSNQCADQWRRRPGAWGQVSGPTAGRKGIAYKAVVDIVRRRAHEGEGCYFCGGGFDWTVHHNDRGAFTAHHLDHLMDGHPAVADPNRMAPAHRSCNSRDGLQKQNDRRRTLQPLHSNACSLATTVATQHNQDEQTSRAW